MTWAVAAAVVMAAAAGYSAYTSYENSKAAQQQAKNDAAARAGQAKVEAERIRKQMEKQRSAALAAAAENGLDVSEGTPVVIDQTIKAEGEEDAWLTELGGISAANRLRVDASNYGKAANSALVGGALNMAAAGMSGYSGWKGSTAASKGAGTGTKVGG